MRSCSSSQVPSSLLATHAISCCQASRNLSQRHASYLFLLLILSGILLHVRHGTLTLTSHLQGVWTFLQFMHNMGTLAESVRIQKCLIIFLWDNPFILWSIPHHFPPLSSMYEYQLQVLSVADAQKSGVPASCSIHNGLWCHSSVVSSSHLQMYAISVIYLLLKIPY